MTHAPSSDDSSLDARLADLIALDPEAPEPWSEEDLAAMWRHQLAAPLSSDLARIPAAEPAIRNWSIATGIHEPTFEDLLHHDSPPLELLKAVQRFGKSVGEWQRSFPGEIAGALYYAAIAVALVNHGARISMLTSEALADGLKWAASLGWMDRHTRDVTRVALRRCSTLEP